MVFMATLRSVSVLFLADTCQLSTSPTSKSGMVPDWHFSSCFVRKQCVGQILLPVSLDPCPLRCTLAGVDVEGAQSMFNIVLKYSQQIVTHDARESSQGKP